ncbi:hypothetical protein FKM82_008990 [Ascaphus truei]
MTEKKLRETEKSPLTVSFNCKEESLLQKKIIMLDSLKKQAADLRTLDQKVLYNRFIMKLRRSEMAHARLIGNKDLIKHLAHSFNATLNDRSEEAVRAIVKHGKPLRVASAPWSRSCMSDTNKSCRGNISLRKIMDENISETESTDFIVFKTEKKSPNAFPRFYSAPGARQGVKKLVQFHNYRVDEPKKNNLFAVHSISQTTFLAKNHESQNAGRPRAEILKCKHSPDTVATITKNQLAKEVKLSEHGQCLRSESNTTLVGTRPKTSPFLDTGGIKSDNPSLAKDTIPIPKDDFESRVKLFIDKVNSMQHNSSLRDYYSDRLLDGPGKKETASLRDEEQREWSLVGQEPYHRSVTIKELDRNFTRNDIPVDILFMEQYNLVLTKENFTVRNWKNNNPHVTAS